MIVNHTNKCRAKCDKYYERSTVLRAYNKETERLEPTNLFTCLFALLIFYLVLLGGMRGVRAIKKEEVVLSTDRNLPGKNGGDEGYRASGPGV